MFMPNMGMTPTWLGVRSSCNVEGEGEQIKLGAANDPAFRESLLRLLQSLDESVLDGFVPSDLDDGATSLLVQFSRH